MKTMKTITKLSVGLMAAATIALSGCGSNKQSESEVAALRAKDSVENVFTNTLAEINSNLDIIKEKEGLLAMKPEKNREGIMSTGKEEVMQNIASINDLLEKNRKKIDELNLQIASFNGEKDRWKKESRKMAALLKQKESDLIALKNQIEQQQLAINELKNTNEGLTKKVYEDADAINELETENAQVNESSAKLDKELHKVYYALGTYKELKKHNVVEKEGGVLGIGRTEELKPDFEKSYFTEVDMRKATGIVINGKKAKLVTHHPVGSYELKVEDKDVEYLAIKDPDKFWSTSKYLVVEVK